MSPAEWLAQLDPQARSLVTRALLALLALALTWLLRRLLARLVLLPLRHLLARRRDDGGELLLSIIALPVRLLVLALGVYLAGNILPTDEASAQFFSQLARSLVILACFAGLYNATEMIVASSLRLKSLTGIALDEQLVPFMRTGLKLVVLALAVVTVLQEWGYDVNGLIAGLGLGGLAVSLAARDTIANLFSFATIVSDKPLRVGDFISTPHVTGIVEEVGARAVRVRMLNQSLVTIPNSKITGDPVTNFSQMTKRRVDFTIGVTYDASSDDLRALISRMREMLRAREMVDGEGVNVFFTGFGESSLNLRVIAMVLEPAWAVYMAEQQQILLATMDIVQELGLSVAFPTRTLHIESLPPTASPPAGRDAT